MVGAMVGYLSLWSVWWLFKQLTGKEGMGHGDFKLLAALGAWVGLKGIIPTILLSSLVGAIVGSIWLASKGRDRATPIPFGPYLAAAGWIVFFWGQPMVDAYLRLSGLR
jgi:leader peptidase (prepilin peptidase)/N-methyltransferase